MNKYLNIKLIIAIFVGLALVGFILFKFFMMLFAANFTDPGGNYVKTRSEIFLPSEDITITLPDHGSNNWVDVTQPATARTGATASTLGSKLSKFYRGTYNNAPSLEPHESVKIEPKRSVYISVGTFKNIMLSMFNKITKETFEVIMEKEMNAIKKVEGSPVSTITSRLEKFTEKNIASLECYEGVFTIKNEDPSAYTKKSISKNRYYFCPKDQEKTIILGLKSFAYTTKENQEIDANFFDMQYDKFLDEVVVGNSTNVKLEKQQ